MVPRDITELAAEIYTELAKLRAVLSDGMLHVPADILPQLEPVMSDVAHVANGNVVPRGHVAVETAPHADEAMPPSGRMLVDMLVDVHGKLTDLINALHQLGTPVTSLSTLLLGLHLLQNIHDSVAGTPDALGNIDEAAERAARDEAAPPAGTLPGARPTSLDEAGRRLGRNLAGRMPAYKPSPVERVVSDLQAQGAVAREANRRHFQQATSGAKTKTYTEPKQYQPKGEYVPKNWRRGA